MGRCIQEEEIFTELHLRPMPLNTQMYPAKGSGGENSDKETCGSNGFFQLQLEVPAC